MDARDEHPDARDQWTTLRKQIRVRAEKRSARFVHGDYAKGGCVYRWGIAASDQAPLRDTEIILSRLACGARVSRKDLLNVDWPIEFHAFSDGFVASEPAPASAAKMVLWAAALPELIDHMDYRQWWDLLGEVQQIHKSSRQRDGSSSLLRLILGVELGLTLAWRLADLPSCKQLRDVSKEALMRWCDHDEDSIANSICGGLHARLALASLLRCRSISEKVFRWKIKRQQRNILSDLAVWVAALTLPNGATAFSTANKNALKDDTKKTGLLAAAVNCDPDTVSVAMKAALGKSHSGGRLVWEVSLPESMQHCDEAKLAVLLPEWDVRRGRMHVDYSGPEVRLEMFSGKSQLLSGNWSTNIAIGDSDQHPIGEWVNNCEYTDDDVHYLELEQNWSGSLVLQRQIMVIRDDRSVLMADSVLRGSRANRESGLNQEIRYTMRLPMTESAIVVPEPETRELLVGLETQQKTKGKQGKRKKPKAASKFQANTLVFPLAASEWRVGPSDAALRVTQDNQLLYTVNGKNTLYAPLWFDFQKTRFSCKRTWRNLTIADELRIPSKHRQVAI